MCDDPNHQGGSGAWDIVNELGRRVAELTQSETELLKVLKELEACVFELGLSRLTEEQRDTCATAAIRARAIIAITERRDNP